MNKLNISKEQTLILTIVLIVLVAGGIGLYTKRNGIERRYVSYQLQKELDRQMKPLNASLAALGFTDLPKPKADCRLVPSDSDPKKLTNKFTCTASTNKYVVVGSGQDVTAKLIEGSQQLSKQLNDNGWQQRKDLPTIAWFEAISRGVDYQPDQLNVKQLEDMTCTVDFSTAFASPAQPAINFQAQCYKPKFKIDI